MFKSIISIALLAFATHAEAFVPASFAVKFDLLEESYNGKNNESSGSIDYQYPNHLKYELITPDNSLLMVNPHQMITFQPNSIEPNKPGQATIIKNPENRLTNFLDGLRGGIKSNHLYTVKPSQDLALEVKTNKQNELGAKEIILTSKSKAKPASLKEVSEIIFIKVNGKKKVYRLKDFKEIKFPAKFFEFTPPAGTKIIKE